MNDKDKGLYHKFEVHRSDGGSEPGGKHEHCRYFVLDMDHDPYAVDALYAYADACYNEYPQLSNDLAKIAHALETKTKREL